MNSKSRSFHDMERLLNQYGLLTGTEPIRDRTGRECLQVAHVKIIFIHQYLPRRDRPVGQFEADDDDLFPGFD